MGNAASDVADKVNDAAKTKIGIGDTSVGDLVGVATYDEKKKECTKKGMQVVNGDCGCSMGTKVNSSTCCDVVPQDISDMKKWDGVVGPGYRFTVASDQCEASRALDVVNIMNDVACSKWSRVTKGNRPVLAACVCDEKKGLPACKTSDKPLACVNTLKKKCDFWGKK